MKLASAVVNAPMLTGAKSGGDKMGLMMCDGKFVSRDEIALVQTPVGTESWKPVPHMEVIDAVTDVVKAHQWQILDENFGLAREGQKMFGVMRINKSNSSDWSRCIGLRNSHDKSFAVGLSAGISVTVCSNLAFGGSTVIKRRHTSRIELTELVDVAMTELENVRQTTMMFMTFGIMLTGLLQMQTSYCQRRMLSLTIRRTLLR